MPTVVGIAGSVRKNSYNRALLRAAARLAPSELEVQTASIAEIPLYDSDHEKAEGVPDSVERIKDQIAQAQGLLLVTPEYNHSIPGVFKNAIDWLSRPSWDAGRVFAGKPVALMGATPGRGGTRLAQAAWLPILRALGTVPWCGKQLHVAGAASVFAEDGELADEAVSELVREYMHAFCSSLVD